MREITVFISSAMRELENEREIVQQVLQEINIAPILFEIFPALSQSPTEAYIDEVKNCDIFVMILWKSLRPAVLKEYEEALKRNKPILILVKTLAENEEREQELKDFLSNLTSPVSTQVVRRTVYHYFRKVSELESVIRQSVSTEIAKFYREPVHTLSREEMYELGTDIIKYAQKRLYLFQKTPSLFLGARNYMAAPETKFFHERDFLDSLETWVEQNYNLNGKEFLYLCSLNATKEELIKANLINNQHYLSDLKNKITYYKNIEERSSYRFKFTMIDIPISGPLIVGDNRYAIWLLGSDDAVSLSQENGKICDLLVRMLRTHSQEQFTASEIILQLGL